MVSTSSADLTTAFNVNAILVELEFRLVVVAFVAEGFGLLLLLG